MLDKISSFVVKITSILPALFILGVIYQLFTLSKVDQLWVFSWSQVINDTLAIVLTVLITQFALHVGIHIGYLNVYKKEAGAKQILTRMILALILFGIALNIRDYLELTRGAYLLLVNIIVGVGVGIAFIDVKKEKDYMVISIIFSVFSILITCMLLSDGYEDLYFKTYNENICTSERVIYVNDKYIVTKSGLVYKNSEDRIFYKKN